MNFAITTTQRIESGATAIISMLGLIVLLLVARTWTRRLAMRTRYATTATRAQVTWKIVLAMGWRLALLTFAVPVVLAVASETPEETARAIAVGVAFALMSWTLTLLSVWQVARRISAGVFTAIARSRIASDEERKAQLIGVARVLDANTTCAEGNPSLCLDALRAGLAHWHLVPTAVEGLTLSWWLFMLFALFAATSQNALNRRTGSAPPTIPSSHETSATESRQAATPTEPVAVSHRSPSVSAGSSAKTVSGISPEPTPHRGAVTTAINQKAQPREFSRPTAARIAEWNRLNPTAPASTELQTAWQALENASTAFFASSILIDAEAVADSGTPDAASRGNLQALKTKSDNLATTLSSLKLRMRIELSRTDLSPIEQEAVMKKTAASYQLMDEMAASALQAADAGLTLRDLVARGLPSDRAQSHFIEAWNAYSDSQQAVLDKAWARKENAKQSNP